MGWVFFPEVKGGKEKANDLFGSLDGWLITKDASKETMDFMKFWLDKDTQIKLAAPRLFIPAVKGTAEAIQIPFLRQIAQGFGQHDARKGREGPRNAPLGIHDGMQGSGQRSKFSLSANFPPQIPMSLAWESDRANATS